MGSSWRAELCGGLGKHAKDLRGHTAGDSPVIFTRIIVISTILIPVTILILTIISVIIINMTTFITVFGKLLVPPRRHC